MYLSSVGITYVKNDYYPFLVVSCSLENADTSDYIVVNSSWMRRQYVYVFFSISGCSRIPPAYHQGRGQEQRGDLDLSPWTSLQRSTWGDVRLLVVQDHALWPGTDRLRGQGTLQSNNPTWSWSPDRGNRRFFSLKGGLDSGQMAVLANLIQVTVLILICIIVNLTVTNYKVLVSFWALSRNSRPRLTIGSIHWRIVASWV